MTIRRLLVSASSLLLLSVPAMTPLGAQRTPGPTQAELTGARDDAENWLYATHDYSGRRYVDLDLIDRTNATELRPLCAFQAGDTRAFHTNPLVHRGVMYLTTRYETIAMDARTCRVRWRSSWDPDRSVFTQANRGAAIKDGRIVRGTADGRLIARDLATGEVIWDRTHADPEAGEKFNMPPLIFEDLVVIGVAGSESGIRGWLGAFRLSDGEPVWRFEVIPSPGAPGAETWGDGTALEHGGGGVWTPVSLDPEAGRLFVGTADPMPAFDGRTRPGANLYTNSLVVLDVRTGELLWHHQTVPHDLHDRGVTSPGPLFTTTVDGRERSLVATAGKDGVLRTLDRESREVLYATPVTTLRDATTPPTEDGVRVCPGLLGGVQWNGPAYHPETNTLFVPAVDWCSTFYRGGDPEDWPMPYLGGALEFDPVERSRGWLSAVDASTGEIRWRYASDAPMVAGVTTTSGGLVFTGEVSGDFMVLDARNGEVLYRFHTGGAVNGGVLTYAIDGEQYVAATSGGMTPFWQRPPGSSTVFIFGLPEPAAGASNPTTRHEGSGG